MSKHKDMLLCRVPFCEECAAEIRRFASLAATTTPDDVTDKSVDSAARLDHPGHMKDSQDTTKVTRFEVIDHTTGGEGRAYVKHDVSVELSYQDEGRTLKVFVGDRKVGDV